MLLMQCGHFRLRLMRSNRMRSGGFFSCARILVCYLNFTPAARWFTPAARWLKAVEQTAESILITDSRGIIEYVNPATCFGPNKRSVRSRIEPGQPPTLCSPALNRTWAPFTLTTLLLVRLGKWSTSSLGSVLFVRCRSGKCPELIIVFGRTPAQCPKGDIHGTHSYFS